MKKLLLVFLFLLASVPARAQGVDGVCALTAEYKSGVDVHGNAVRSADLGEPQSIQSRKIDIPVTIDLAQKFGLNLPQGLELKPDIAMMSIYNDGRIEWNGQEISAQIETICSSASVKVHRQTPPQTLHSPKHDKPNNDAAVIKGIYPPE